MRIILIFILVFICSAVFVSSIQVDVSGKIIGLEPTQNRTSTYTLDGYTITGITYKADYYSSTLNDYVDYDLPLAFDFVSNKKTTDFSSVEDISHVDNLTLSTNYGAISFGNRTINAKDQDYDNNIIFGDCFVAVNATNLDYTFNATAYLLMNNSDGHCGDNTIFTSDDVVADAGAVKSSAKVCKECEVVSENNLNAVKYRVPHFSSYAIGSNSNLTINSTTPRMVNHTVNFSATYRNITSGDFISGADCDIFLNGESHNMVGQSGVYVYSDSFLNAGLYEYNVTCIKTGFQTLKVNDTFEITPPPVPEFNVFALALIFGMVAVLVYIRKGGRK